MEEISNSDGFMQGAVWQPSPEFASAETFSEVSWYGKPEIVPAVLGQESFCPQDHCSLSIALLAMFWLWSGQGQGNTTCWDA